MGPAIGDPPELWPGFDVSRPSAFSAAWSDLWSRLDGDWVPLVEIQNAVAEAHDLQPKTIYNMIRTARTNGHVERKGGYSRKNQTDTRQIRRHIKAAAS